MPINKNRTYKLIGKKLKIKRIAAGKTQEQLAKDLGLSRTSITNIENGSQKLPLYLLYSFCDILDTEISEILPTVKELRTDKNLKVHGEITPDITNLINTIIENKQ